MISEIIAITAGLVSVATGIINNKLSKQKTQAELEMKIRSKALDFAQFIQDWNETHDDIEKLLKETEIDRFILFRAWNGFSDPKWTTSVLQILSGKQVPINYIHFDLDEDYKERLKFCEVNNHNYLVTKDLSETSVIKKVYETEGVNASMWCHIIDLDGPSNSRILIYCSLSTTTHEEISQKTIFKAKALVSKIKINANEFQLAQQIAADEADKSKETPAWKFWKK